MWVCSFGSGMKKGMLYPAGINELKHSNSKLIVYPDPAIENIVVIFNGFLNKGKLSIMNEQGKEIMARKIEGIETVVPVFYLSSGVYFVRVTCDNGIFVTKFVKE